MSVSTIIGAFAIALVLIVIFQIAKVMEYTSVLSGEKESKKTSNNVNAVLFLVFLVGGLFAIYKFNQVGAKKILTISSSEEGETSDLLMWITVCVTGVVFFITQAILFIFVYRYRYSEKRKPTYFSHSTKLEIVWTTIPAIAMFILVSTGLVYWYKVTGDAPKNSMRVEVTGKQFEWIFRYPGKDGILGKKYFRNINEVDNRLGLLWEDKTTQDDIIVDELHLVVGKPVELIVGSRDVIHDVGLPHFRMKIDAVPGIPTKMWFTPKYTTEEMKKLTKNKEFTYELACDQMCGKGHYSMRAIVVVETQAQYNAWLASKKPAYADVQQKEEPKQEIKSTSDATHTHDNTLANK